MQFITLLSDLGDYSAGVAKTKSILMQQLPGKTVIDVTHNIYPFYLQEASYLLASSIHDFAPGTFHIILFDLYYTDIPRLVLASVNDQYVFAPDNGVLPLAFGNKLTGTWSCHNMSGNTGLSGWMHAVTDTINEIGVRKPNEAGLEEYELQNAPFESKPIVYTDRIECSVIHIDRFENIILNITKDDFETAAKGRAFSIDVIRGDSINTISNNYNSVPTGEKLCRFNSAGYMEIAINKGNAAKLFGIKVIRERNKPHNTIKISFE